MPPGNFLMTGSGLVYLPDTPALPGIVVIKPVPEDPPAPRLRSRKSAGDPRCDACVLSERGVCADHLDYHAAYDAVRGVA